VIKTIKGQRISGINYIECSVPLDLLNITKYYELSQSPVKLTYYFSLSFFRALHIILLITQFAEGHE
jgi:hypothetical protein